MHRLAVLVLTKNEENNIKACIENAHQCTDEVIIIDSGSTDKTIEIAKKAGAKVCYREWDNDFAAQRNFALKHTEAEWVFYLDADERMSEEMIADIQRIVNSERMSLQYKMLRRTMAFGKEFKYGVLSPDYVLRMFPRSEVKWQGQVHEKAVCDLPVRQLQGYLKHHTYNNWEQYIAKMNQYSSIGATNNNLKGKKVHFIKDIILRPMLAFVKMYFLKLGFLEGKLGYVLAVSYANYTMNKYVKLWHLAHKS